MPSGNSSKYQSTNYSVSSLLSYIENDEIAVPDIQRPFVWQGRQVRDLIDSLYNGYPTGYLIIWQNPTVHLKDGTEAGGKKLLIDGQQRVTALMTAVAGKSIITSDYREKRIIIAFNPLAQDDEERFAVKTAAHERSHQWISDISMMFKNDFDSFSFVDDYRQKNPDVDPKVVNAAVQRLLRIRDVQLGAIVLDSNLTIDEVTEIFIRVNSRGKSLNAADFAMSKIAADEAHGGANLRKAVDYFCHLASDPGFYKQLVHDEGFAASPYAQKLAWLKKGLSSVFVPDFDDMLRVSFMHKFTQGKLANLVGSLSGRDTDTRTYSEEKIEESFSKLSDGVLDFMNEHNYNNFSLALRGAGFTEKSLVRSQITLDFAYTLYLYLNKQGDMSPQEEKRFVAKWYVLTTLTGRYIGSPESWMDRDLRSLASRGFEQTFSELEESTLSETYWGVTLPQRMETPSISSPFLNVYLAAQVFFSCHSLFSNALRVADLLHVHGDVHHVFPKAYLAKHGFDDKNQYNQIANYAYLDTGVNIKISDKAPHEYFREMADLCSMGDESAPLESLDALKQNLAENCIPESILCMAAKDYPDFLYERRKLMASLIRRYYERL